MHHLRFLGKGAENLVMTSKCPLLTKIYIEKLKKKERGVKKKNVMVTV